ncbi:MAG: efflux RND transporter periplasmic adaptor subunit [Sedimentisphaerales bacterium]|nr:efflux RND transporter periplasmic adaptor subunit [Sedimentisphaerales bacterium]
MTANPENAARPTRSTVRRKVLIGLVVTACVAGGVCLLLLKRAGAQDGETPEQASTPTRTAVVTTAAATRQFERTLVVQGNVQAEESALVSPRIPGTIEAIFVDEGDAVVAGQTKLFRTDAANLERNVEIKEHALKVAQCSRREAEANLERIEVDLRKAELDYRRFERLLEKEAVTTDAFEQQQSRYRQLQAARKLAQAQVELTLAKQEQSQAELAIAGKDLADAVVSAPISGKVSLRLQEPGETGSPGRPVLRIDDTSVVEVAAFLPAQYYAAIVPEQTTMRIGISGIDVGTHIITYKSPTIQPKLRTFEIKCVLRDPPEGVTSGAMAQIVVVLDSREGLGVPSQAIQQRGGRSVVFVVENGAAQEVPVETGIESEGWTEIRGGDLTEAAAVVSMGQYMVEAGTPVHVQEAR